MRKMIIALATVGTFALSTVVAVSTPAEARIRGYTRATGLATFAYDWGVDYGYYRQGYYNNYVSPYYDRYVYDKDLLAPYSCCGYITTTFYADQTGSHHAVVGRPASVYYGVPHHRKHH